MVGLLVGVLFKQVIFINFIKIKFKYLYPMITDQSISGSRLRPKTLQAVDVPVIDNRMCERWHRSNGIHVVIYDEMMCAGYRGGGKDSCQVMIIIYFIMNNVLTQCDI